MKNKVYELIVDIWRLASKYQFKRLTEAEWDAFISAGVDLCKRYRQQSPGMEQLCRDLFYDFQKFYERGIDDEKGAG